MKKLKHSITSGSGVVVSLPNEHLGELNSLPDGSYEIEGTKLSFFGTTASFEIEDKLLFIYEPDCDNVLYQYLIKAEEREDS